MGSNQKENEPAQNDNGANETNQQEEISWEEEEEQKEILRSVAKMASLPRLVHMQTTAETVNAVEALVMAGEVDATNCCALIDRKEGVQALERTLKRETRFVQESNQSHQWSLYESILPKTTNGGSQENDSGEDDDDDEDNPDRTVTTGGLQIICSSSIHDNLFRQCRQWARMGYTANEIQNEFDAQYVDLLRQIHTVQQEVREVVTNTPNSSSLPSNEEEINKKDGNVPSQLIDTE
mmetsp:Transcript_25770/g.45442  ORF Transcript_25770/g.45442 Transcript_25770/m.45442 type:complete len:237 (+) Transcript_25770:67-777(+)